MYRYIAFILVCFIFSACSITNSPKYRVQKFDGEDLMTLEALMLEKDEKTKEAIDKYNEIYLKNDDVDYLKKAVQIAYMSNYDDELKKLLSKSLAKYPNDNDLVRIQAGVYIKDGNFKEAKKLMNNLIKKEKTALNLNIVGSIYFYEGNYDTSLKYYESSYQLEKSQETMFKIVDLLYGFLEREKEAIAYLETEIRLEGCSPEICYKLIEIYGKKRDINGLISTYKKLYERFKTQDYAQKVIDLLLYKKDFYTAIRFLETTKSNEKLLMEVYVVSKDFQKAYQIANKLYNATNDAEYLGRMAMYEYEANMSNMNKKILKSISYKFEKTLQELRIPLYLNYYGYLLIEHDLNPKKGIKLVKEALSQEPNSMYYIDSLAWGYYKINKCKKAYETIKEIIGDQDFILEDEILKHYNAIKKCLEKK